MSDFREKLRQTLNEGVINKALSMASYADADPAEKQTVMRQISAIKLDDAKHLREMAKNYDKVQRLVKTIPGMADDPDVKKILGRSVVDMLKDLDDKEQRLIDDATRIGDEIKGAVATLKANEKKEPVENSQQPNENI